jgi:quercetin dioxygenase-like cupin family protein
MMSTTSYAEAPVTHRVSNVGATLFHLIGVTNASAGDESDAPATGFDVAPEIVNRWFRGYRHELGAGEGRDHRHANPVAIVLASGAMTLVSAPGPAVSITTPGFVALVDANVRHRLEATAPGSHIIEVEIRRAAKLQ